MNDKKDRIITNKDQANHQFEKMRIKEIDRLNFNYNDTKKFLIEVRDKLHSEKMVRDFKVLKDLEKLIIEYIDIIANISLTLPESCHFEKNNHLVERNTDYNEKAIKSLKQSLKTIKGRINKNEDERVDSEYTVKSVIMAYLYMYLKGIYPIPEIEEHGKKCKFYKKLSEKYQLSYYSVRNDWPPLEKEENRIVQFDNIKIAIKLLESFEYAQIKEAIELANSELNKAELKI